MEKIKGKVYHLSHIDLDGYGCQYLTTNLVEEVVCFNSDYGKGIKEALINILVLIDKDLLNNINPNLLITDLNLTEEDATFIDLEMKNRNLNIILLDHHLSGKSVSEKYDWYFLDTSICATKATYFYLSEAIGYSKMNNSIYSLFSDIVNDYDLWKEDNPLFKQGKLLNFIIFNTSFSFPKEVIEEKRKFLLFSLDFIIKILYSLEYSINQIEKEILPLVKELFLKEKIPNEIYYDNNILIEDKYNFYVYELMKNMDFPIIEIDNKKIKVFYEIDGGVFQNIASIFNSYTDGTYHCCMNVLKTGKISLRSKGNSNNHNVSDLSNKYFNGGGHFNASGGTISIENKKELSRTDVLDYLKAI